MKYTIKTLDGDVDVEADSVEISLPDGRILDAFVHRSIALGDNGHIVSAGGFKIEWGATRDEAVKNATDFMAWKFNADRGKFEAALAYAGVAPREAGGQK